MAKANIHGPSYTPEEQNDPNIPPTIRRAIDDMGKRADPEEERRNPDGMGSSASTALHVTNTDTIGVPHPTVVPMTANPSHAAPKGEPGVGSTVGSREEGAAFVEGDLPGADGGVAETESEEDEVNYDEWTVAQLKAELKRRELSTTGKQAELAQRLKDDDEESADEEDDEDDEEEDVFGDDDEDDEL